MKEIIIFIRNNYEFYNKHIIYDKKDFFIVVNKSIVYFEKCQI